MARLKTAVAAVAVFLAASVIAGCGGDSDDTPPPVSDQDRAALERVSDEIVRSAAEKDPVRFCAVVQPSLVEDAFGGIKGCRAVIRQSLRQNSRLLGNLEIEKITVQDQGAIVTYAQDPPGDILFVREQGKWYLALNDLALQRQGATGGTGPQGDG